MAYVAAKVLARRQKENRPYLPSIPAGGRFSTEGIIRNRQVEKDDVAGDVAEIGEAAAYEKRNCCNNVNDWLLLLVWNPAFHSLRRGLTVQDAPLIVKELTSSYLLPKAEAAWARELDPKARARRCCGGDKPSYFRMLFAVIGTDLPRHTSLSPRTLVSSLVFLYQG